MDIQRTFNREQLYTREEIAVLATGPIEDLPPDGDGANDNHYLIAQGDREYWFIEAEPGKWKVNHTWNSFVLVKKG